MRYDHLSLADTPVIARTGNKAQSWTLGLNWYLTANAKLLFMGVKHPNPAVPEMRMATQARDLQVLDEKYRVEMIQPVDMFPHTHHIENVVRLILRK